MKRFFFTFILIIISLIAGAKSGENEDPVKFNALRKEIKLLKEEINNVKNRQQFQSDQINGQTGMIDTAFDGISAELSASSIFIGIFGIIIAVFSIGLSIYVSRIEKNVKRMKGDSELLLQKNIQIKQELQSLSDKITNDTVGLYKLIRNEESNHMIYRLISVPEDIDNLFSNLASRDLEKEHFLGLKEAFQQLSEKDDGYGDYMTLFFQHFSDLSLLDNDVKPKFFKTLTSNFSVAFKNDAIKSVSDFFGAIIQIKISKSISEINEYVTALCKSPFVEKEEIYFAINDVMSNRDNKFELYGSIGKNNEVLIFRKKLGKLILEHKFENLTPKEEALIQDINQIIKS